MAGLLKKHPYIVATLLATILAIVVWMCMPKEYTAITKLSDEYKEIDLAIGLNDMKAHIKNLMNNGNAGMNDMAVYCKILKTEDFARKLSHKKVPNKNMTYGEYLAEEDTIENILDHINYNYSSKQETLTISFTDKDPVVAAQMLDSITAQLQLIITRYRQSIADASLQNAERNLSAARLQYEQAQKNYASFVDTHIDINTQQYKQQEKALDKTVSITENLYQKATEEYARQKALKQRSYMSFAVIQDNSTPQKSSKYFIGYLFSFLFIALLFTHGYICLKRKKIEIEPHLFSDYFSPWTLTIIIWSLILGLYYLLDTPLYPITEQFYYCFIIWIPIFCICSYLSYELTDSVKSNHQIGKGIEFNKNIFTFLLIITMIITPLYVYRIYQIVSMFDPDDMMENIRTLAIFGEGQGFLGQSIILNQALLITALWAYPRIPLWQVIVPVLACCLNAIAIMEKGTMFFVFICIIFVLHHKKIIQLRSIILAGIILVSFFYIFNLQRAGEDSDYSKNETITDFIAMYILSPPVALCQLMPDTTPQFGTNTFGTIYHFMIRFGVNDVVEKLKTQGFVMVPIPTNVYTIFQPFFIDFGYKGIAFFAALYGIICGWLYRLYKNSNNVGCCLYTFMIYALVLQFYQENIFLSLATVIEFVIFVYLMTQKQIIIRFIPHNNDERHQ